MGTHMGINTDLFGIGLYQPQVEKRRIARLATVLVGLVAVASLLGLTSPPANAWYIAARDRGLVGGVRFLPSSNPSVIALQGYNFHMPAMEVSRNRAVSANSKQELTVRWDVQFYNSRTGRWINDNAVTGQYEIDMVSAYDNTIGTTVTPSHTVPSRIRQPGFYRVVIQFWWGIGSGPFFSNQVTGYMMLAPSTRNDMTCGHYSCNPNYVTSHGALYLTG